MKVRSVKPCSEFPDKVIVICDLDHPLNIKLLSAFLRTSKEFDKTIFLEKSDLAWITSGAKRILVNSNGKITVSGADDIDDALKAVDRIQKMHSMMFEGGAA
jgi:ArsR family metal-binding transcriptional regulator